MVRFKNRYLLLEWKFSSLEVGHRTLQEENGRSVLAFIREAVQTLHGDYGLACVQHSLKVKYLNVSTLVTILRCPRAHYRAVWSSLSTITSYKGEPCTLIVLHLGGTIQSSQKALVKHNAAVLKREVSSAKTVYKRQEAEKKLREILKKDSIPIRI